MRVQRGADWGFPWTGGARQWEAGVGWKDLGFGGPGHLIRCSFLHPRVSQAQGCWEVAAWGLGSPTFFILLSAEAAL